MKKKWFCLLVVAMILMVSIASGESAFVPGTYTGEGNGMDTLQVSVTLSETGIESIEIIQQNETPAIGGEVLKTLPQLIVASQSTQLDIVSGATITSQALLDAVNAALISAGIDPASLIPVSTAVDDEAETLSTDVVIVGAGGAGMTAALKIAELGYQSILVEKQAFVGGATAMSSSSALASGTRMQAEQGIIDSPELCMAELLKVGEYENDATPTWLLSKYSGAAIDWLNDEMGVLFKESCGTPSAEYSVGRARSSVTGSGAGLCQDIKAKLDENNIPVILNTRAYELTVENGVINGILARDVNTGKEYRITGKAVLLATGGYCFDDDYISEALKQLPCSGSKANTGDGLDMAIAVGAATQNMNKVALSAYGIRKGDSAQHTQPQCKAAYKSTGTILINMDGNRFINEQTTHAALIKAMLLEDRVFMLMDAASFNDYAVSCIERGYYSQADLDQWLAENGSGITVFAHGDTLDAVAAQVGMNAEGLKAAFERYNNMVASGEDTDFGRTVTAPIGEGPYYLVEQSLRYATTMGGLTINSQLQAVDHLNNPIPGLYAAGELVGGVFGANFPPSTGVGWALTSGMLAGQEIIAEISK